LPPGEGSCDPSPTLDCLGSILSWAGRRLERAVELSSDSDVAASIGTGEPRRRRLRGTFPLQRPPGRASSLAPPRPRPPDLAGEPCFSRMALLSRAGAAPHRRGAEPGRAGARPLSSTRGRRRLAWRGGRAGLVALIDPL